MSLAVQVRHERPDDVTAVRRVNQSAFGRSGEADLVDRLRDACEYVVSLVAVTDSGEVVGHALFTPATIRLPDREIVGSALGPVAVLPQFQRRGIGSTLIRAGIEQLQGRGDPFLIVLGHPEYYPRFGFEPALSRHGVRCKWDVPDEVFMIRIFNPRLMGDVRGDLAIYRPEFDAV